MPATSTLFPQSTSARMWQSWPSTVCRTCSASACAYYEGKQIALHRISYQKKDMVVNPQHYRRLTLKQSMDVENPLLEQGNIIAFPLKSRDLSRYDEVLYE